jgi:pyruvate,orthophosphate dikinase
MSTRRPGRKSSRKVRGRVAKPNKPAARRAAKKPVQRSAGKKTRHVYAFGGGKADGRAEMRDLLGGKGANLAEMARLGINVPPGFTITTEVCTHFMKHDGGYPGGLKAEVENALARLEKEMGRRFGDPERPLLVSVRSGARASMPGMMDTVLNLGLTAQTVEGLIRESQNPRFGWDCYRRFVQMFGDVVLGLKPEGNDPDPFEELIESRKKEKGVELDVHLTADDLQDLARRFKDLIHRRLRVDFPDDPMEQLWQAIGAVFRSWMNPRAKSYRRLNAIPEEWGTAVNVQAMVFGNVGENCATGVAFTRNPANGEKGIYGEFLVNAQGEDVVAGTRTPQEITRVSSQKRAAERKLSEAERSERWPSLEELMPSCYRDLVRISRTLEKHYRDTQDLEFTIERGRLWMLQTRTGKRTASAAIKIAVDMVKEGLIDRRTAVLRVEPEQLDQILHPQLDRSVQPDLLAKGLPASPGAVSGEVVFSAEDAVKAAAEGHKAVLVRVETSPEDIDGMHAAQGILTARGGMTSHAAVVARGMGKCCVAGCGELEIDYKAQLFRVGDRVIRRGDLVTLDGTTGEVFAGAVPTLSPELGKDFVTFMKWADDFRRLGVRANADTPHDATVARHFGAAGIGLCRTEHMFFDKDRIEAVREMILAGDQAGRERALKKLLPYQKSDFLGILRAMQGYPVTIRLLDPPLHEFLPAHAEDLAPIAANLGVPTEELRRTWESLREANPMLGHRGCRLAITYPEIYAMQVRAIVEATCELRREGVKVLPEIMIPLVGDRRELEVLRREVLAATKQAAERYEMKVTNPIGTMIELPRAALTADGIADAADFFSFGTNDLTQTTFGLSRDDAGKFLPAYVQRGLLPLDPFVSLDQEGVGELVRIGVERGRRTRKDLKIGICGEHGGDPASVAFCHDAGLDYVSCSPFRVPIARLAAAHAALKNAREPADRR